MAAGNPPAFNRAGAPDFSRIDRVHFDRPAPAVNRSPVLYRTSLLLSAMRAGRIEVHAVGRPLSGRAIGSETAARPVQPGILGCAR
jgi:hypothetical protein